MAQWLGCWTCNLVVSGSSPPPCPSLDLFLVTPRLHCVNSQLVCLLAVGIFKHSYRLYGLFLISHCKTPLDSNRNGTIIIIDNFLILRTPSDSVS